MLLAHTFATGCPTARTESPVEVSEVPPAPGALVTVGLPDAITPVVVVPVIGSATPMTLFKVVDDVVVVVLTGTVPGVPVVPLEVTTAPALKAKHIGSF